MSAPALPRSDAPFACRDEDPELFFTEAPARVEEAKAVCRRCPAIEACLSYSLRHGVSGTWAATTEQERKAVRKQHGIVAEPMASFGLGASRSESIRRMYLRGLSPAEIGMTLGVQAETVRRAIRDMKAAS
jgi:WhiB family redox-sensing transcriptional regulator